MSKTGVKPVMDQPVTLFGKLQVGGMRENGYLVGIYAMDGEKMEALEQSSSENPIFRAARVSKRPRFRSSH